MPCIETIETTERKEDILSSYESRLEKTANIFDTTRQLLQDFQETFFSQRYERENMKTELRESLAKHGSLRKKDFDHMMQGIFLGQEEKEKEARGLLNTYLNEQKEMAQALRERLREFKDSLVKGETERVKEFQAWIQEILARQDERKDEITSQLKEFQKQQEELAKKLKTLLGKERELRIKDIKDMLQEFKRQHQEFRVRQQGQREEVLRKLNDFKTRL